MIRLGGSDCEQALTDLLTQPVNALSSLAFIPAGMLTVVAGVRAAYCHSARDHRRRQVAPDHGWRR